MFVLRKNFLDIYLLVMCMGVFKEFDVIFVVVLFFVIKSFKVYRKLNCLLLLKEISFCFFFYVGYVFCIKYNFLL